MNQSSNPEPRLEHLQPSVLVIVLKLIGTLFLLDTLYAFVIVGFYGLQNFHSWHDSYILGLLLSHTAKYALITGFIIQIFVDWAGRAYYLSGHHLIEKIGILNITETTHELSQVKSVVLSQTWLARRFNYGTIKLTFAGAGKEKEILLRNINNPVEYKQYFDDHLQVQGWVR